MSSIVIPTTAGAASSLPGNDVDLRDHHASNNKTKPLAITDKKRKVTQEDETIMTKSPTKKTKEGGKEESDVELASAMALASLASFSSPANTTAAILPLAASMSFESRSPKSERIPRDSHHYGHTEERADASSSKDAEDPPSSSSSVVHNPTVGNRVFPTEQHHGGGGGPPTRLVAPMAYYPSPPHPPGYGHQHLGLPPLPHSVGGVPSSSASPYHPFGFGAGSAAVRRLYASASPRTPRLGGMYHPSFGGGGGMPWASHAHAQAHHHHPRMMATLMQPPLLHGKVAGAARGAESQQKQHRPMPGTKSNNTTTTTHPWVCDYCNQASFATYEQACAHEDVCKLGPQHKPAELLVRRQANVRPDHAAHRLYRPLRTTTATILQEETATVKQEPQETATTTTRPSFVGSMSLALDGTDPEWLSDVNCYIRKACVQAFATNQLDVKHRSPFQVGIQCIFCKDLPPQDRGAGAVSVPLTVSGIYESFKRWHRVHSHVCPCLPVQVADTLEKMQEASSKTWIPTTRQYWTDSARALGLVDTPHGIRFSIDPSTIGVEERKQAGRLVKARQGMMMMSTAVAVRLDSETTGDEDKTSTSASASGGEYICHASDMEMIPPYVYFLMRQVEPCRFTEADRFVARSKGPVGYPGFQCRHCHGHAGLGKYFPISAKTLSTNSTSQNIHAHLLKCRKCPAHLQHELVQLKIAKSKAPRLEPGWRRVFFDVVWGRLHGNNNSNKNDDDGEKTTSHDETMTMTTKEQQEDNAGETAMPNEVDTNTSKDGEE